MGTDSTILSWHERRFISICAKHKKLDRLFKSKSDDSEYPCWLKQSHLKTRRTYVRNNSNSSPDSPANWRAPYLASQPELGILSHWRPWVAAHHSDCSPFTWENLRRVSVEQTGTEESFNAPKRTYATEELSILERFAAVPSDRPLTGLQNCMRDCG